MRLDTSSQQCLPVPAFLQNDLLDTKPTTAILVRLHYSVHGSTPLQISALSSWSCSLAHHNQHLCRCHIVAVFAACKPHPGKEAAPDMHSFVGCLGATALQASAPLQWPAPNCAHCHTRTSIWAPAAAVKQGAAPFLPDGSRPATNSRPDLTGFAPGEPPGGLLNIPTHKPSGLSPSYAAPHREGPMYRLIGVRGAIRSSHPQGRACRAHTNWTARRC